MPGEPTPGGTHVDDLDEPDGRPDLVESSPRRLTLRQRRWVAAIAVVVLLLAAVAWYADGRRRLSEFDRLADCVATGESARVDADARVAGMSSYVRPSLGVSPNPDVDQQLYRLVARQAVVGAPEVQRALRTCRQVSLLPFHSALKSARNAYLAYLAAEAAQLSSIAGDGSHAFDDTDELVSLHTQALTALRSAAPNRSGRQRLDQVVRVKK